jgi:hypothetical protein
MSGSDRPAWRVIKRGIAGWSALAPNVTSSGGSLESYALEAEPGAVVYDAFEAHRSAFVDLVVNGPILSVELAPDAHSRMSQADREAMARMSGPGGLSGEYRTLALASLAMPEWSGLDRVGWNHYRRLLERVPGVRFGRVQSALVVWEGGADGSE